MYLFYGDNDLSLELITLVSLLLSVEYSIDESLVQFKSLEMVGTTGTRIPMGYLHPFKILEFFFFFFFFHKNNENGPERCKL